jgi:hypothetical protein
LEEIVKKIVSLSFVSLCTLAAGLSLSNVSLADTPACNGFEQQPGNFVAHANCWFNGGCAMNMQCAPGVFRWEVADFNASAGNHTPKVTGRRPNGGTFSCAACSTTKEGNFAACTAFVPLSVVDQDTQFTIGTVNVPTSGGLFVVCDMSVGSWYESVAF